MKKLPKPKKQHIAKLLIRHETCFTCVYSTAMSGKRCHCKARTYFNKRKGKWQYKPKDKRDICEWHRNRYQYLARRRRGIKPFTIPATIGGTPSVAANSIKNTYPMSKPKHQIFHLKTVYKNGRN